MRNFVGLIALVAALPLASCNTTSSEPPASAQADPPPADYRAQTLTYLQRSFFDPYSVRSAAITQPFLQFGWELGDAGRAWSVCVQANAKNRMGAYTGVKDIIVRFKNGQPVDHNDEGRMYFCKNAQYQPFPELEGDAGTAQQ